MLFDLNRVPDDAANFSLECMCKAMAEPPTGDDGIWAPHESPFLNKLVEAFTQQGLSAFVNMADALEKWVSGANHVAGIAPFPGYGPFWPVEKLPAVGAYLASKAPGSLGLADLEMLVDYLLQLHLPPSFAATHAEWLAVRSAIMGKLEAAAPHVTTDQADNVLAAMPNTIGQTVAAFDFTKQQQAVMEYGVARCAESIVSLADAIRHKLKGIILGDVAERMSAGAVGSSHALQTKLFDAFGDFNRDWRRIAVTEAGEVKNQGFLSNMPIGSRLKRMEHYRGACSFCARLDGKVFELVSPDSPNKDGDTQVWVGKTNLGRSASPRKKFMGSLVHREAAELWWPAAGLQHPHCRGSWVLLGDKLPGSAPDAKWEGWLSGLGVH
jgi:hypothetical protein